MFSGTDWITERSKAEIFSLRTAEICSTIPMRGDWEPNDRIAFAMASFRLTQEHHSSVHLLFSQNKHASANALARPLLEAGLRTIWISEDATDKDVGSLVKGRESVVPLLGDLNHCLSRRSEIPLNGKLRGMLDSFTHGGIKAMAAQFVEGKELQRSTSAMVTLAGFTLGAAGYAIALVLNRPDIMNQLVNATPTLD